jgi:PPOX class probable F420-dependent enzyme
MQPSPEALTFIQRQRVGRLATADAQSRPHVIPVCFVYLDGLLYSVVDEKPKRSTRLRRLRNIESNPRVTLLLDEYSDDWSRLAWVMVEGVATVVEDREERGPALAALRGKYQQYRSMALEGRPLVRITPERILSWGAL